MRQSKEKSRLLTFDGVVLLRLDSELYFANCDYVKQKVQQCMEEESAEAVILDCGKVSSKRAEVRVHAGMVERDD